VCLELWKSERAGFVFVSMLRLVQRLEFWGTNFVDGVVVGQPEME